MKTGVLGDILLPPGIYKKSIYWIMTKYDVIDEIAKTNQVEKIVYRLLGSSKNPFDCPQDLIQDIYLLILKKDDSLILSLYEKGQLGYYILKIARNQMLSKNSPYYYNYIKFRVQSDDLESAKNISQEDRRRV